MKCHKHHDRDVVSHCLDCGKGLCPECTDRWSFPVCNNCAQFRASSDKKSVIKKLLFMIVLFALGFIFMFSPNLAQESFSANLIAGIISGYLFAGIPCGWGFLNRITPSIFLILPLFGWLLYFFLKATISFFIGGLILPFTLYASIKDYNNAKQIQEMINNNAY